MMSDDALPTVSSELGIGRAPSRDAQAAAELFLSTKERTEAINSLVKLPPDVMASALLSQIPFNDSMNRNKTNTILQALEYVKEGIQHRAKSRGVYFCNGTISLPEDTLIHVFNFLDKDDLIHGVSHVSIAWAKASLSPAVRRWRTIDYYKPPTAPTVVGGFTQVHYSNITTRELLLQMLGRPQFALLKKLVVPLSDIKLTMPLVKEIAQVCPELEELGRVGFYYFSADVLHQLPTLFPKLNRAALEMTNSQDVIQFVQALGERLVGLEIKVHDDMETGLTDEDLVRMVQHCPSLRSFNYWSCKGSIDDPYVHSVITMTGLVALIQGCPHLEELSLVRTCHCFTSKEIKYIATHAKNLHFLDISWTWYGKKNDQLLIRKLLHNRLDESSVNDEDVRCDLFQYKLLPLV